MAYVNVAEWTAVHVGDWLRGLDDSILPYVQFFVNNQINGCRLLLLTPHDLLGLNILKVGHQEIILEAVELLKQLHYSFTSETLQTIALKLACRSRSLYNQLRHYAAAQAAKAALDAAAAVAAAENDHHKAHHHKEKHRKDKHKDKDKNKHADTAPPTPAKKKEQPGTPMDDSPVSTGTLNSVAEILAAVKDFMSWIDRYPFDGQEKYIECRKAILKLAIELASTAQRDQFVQGPNEVIRERCKEVAEICDRMVQELSDSLAMQSATLEVVTVTKNVKEELGMHIHSSYSGIHQVGGLKYDSPAQRNENIEEGDEIVQVNYQTVVGWQLKKLVASMRQFPTKIILTVKKRPRHYSMANYTLIAPYALPIPEITVLGSGPGGSRSHQVVLQNADQYYGIPAPVVPIPENSLICSPPGISPLPIPNSVQHNNATQQQAATTDSTSEIIYSTGPQNPIPVSAANYATYNGHQQPQSQSIYGNNLTPQNIPATGMIPHTLSQYNAAKNSPSKSDKLSNNNKAQVMQQQMNTAVKTLAVESPQKSAPQKYAKKPHVHRSKNGTERKSRVATTRCSSASDSSPFSLSDSTSTMYSSSDEGGTEVDLQKRPLDAGVGVAGASIKAAIDARNRKSGGFKSSRRTTKKNNCECTTEDDSEADYSANEDNDSAFYSGRNTSVNDVNGSGTSSNGSASGRCSGVTKMPPAMAPTNVIHSLAQLKLSSGSSGTEHIRPDASSPPIVMNMPEMAVTTRSGRPAPIQPRTSAEFEALFLQKNSGSQESMMTAIPATSATTTMPTKVARASTLPPNTQPCSMIEHEQSQSKPEQTQASMCNTTAVKNVMPPSKKMAMTSIVNSLTNLAQNIRTANTVSVNSMGAVTNSAGISHSSAAQMDITLANKIHAAFANLTKGDTEMGNHEDMLFIYRGGSDSNNSGSPPRGERLPALGPMVLDHAALECSKWTKIHAVLQQNCLFTSPIAPSQTNCSNVRFELPVHLPGYYILVNKTDILGPQNGALAPNGPSMLLYVFKLVTYHHLYLFAVDSPSKLAQWIVKFGYKFCCNPNESQLCFTYYLSTVHVDSISKTAQVSQKRSITSRSAASSVASQYASSSGGNDSPMTNGTDHITRQPSSCSTNQTAPSFTTESELESDDYNDLMMSGEHRVKFNDPMNGITELTSTSEQTNDQDQQQDELSESRRFAKSPHPRGSARFAVRPLNNNHDFIDSIVDRKKSLENAISSLEEDEHIFVEIETPISPPSPVIAKKQETPAAQVPPELPPRSSAGSSASVSAPTPTEAPRPKPRISKMASVPGATATPPTPSSRPSLPAKELTAVRSKAQSLVSNRQHLAPIPVPEKSAAISQTIQHFANLQRQNNLRRSNQHLNASQSTPTPPPSKPSPVPPVEQPISHQSQSSYSDYDYIGAQRPTVAPSSTARPQTPPALPPSKSSQQGSPGVGNPLYCSVPPPLNQRPQPPVPQALDLSNSSALDREYNRLYGDSKPNFTPADDSPSECSSSSEPTSECSPPPPKGSPPPLPPQTAATVTTPPIVRECVLKPCPTDRPDIEMISNAEHFPDDNNNNIDEAVATTQVINASFSSTKITSPKMIKRNKPKHPGPLGAPIDNSYVNTPEPQNVCPPTLLPRRSNVKQKSPPPLPTTSHPSLSKANSNASAQALEQPQSPVAKLNGGITSPAVLSAKSLNRSFSDAYTRSPSGRIKPRKSLESGLMFTPEQMAAVQLGAQNEDGLPPMPNTPTSRSIFLEQLLGQKGLSPDGSLMLAGSTSDLSSRSAPTMGVSMLGKKRLSNVSTDCYSIEKALTAHNDKQCEILRKPSISSFDGHMPTSPLARTASMNNPSPRSRVSKQPEEHQQQWDQIERTLVETKQRLLKN